MKMICEVIFTVTPENGRLNYIIKALSYLVVSLIVFYSLVNKITSSMSSGSSLSFFFVEIFTVFFGLWMEIYLQCDFL